MLGRLVGTDTPAAEEQLQNIARFFEIVRSQSALLADDRAVFVAPHLATLIEAGDDPATAELDPDADAVAVLTVHKAKGLEFPVVFLPGMVAGRFPSARSGRRRWRCPAGLGRGEPPTAELALAEERRLCYVAMTRARDELVLSPRRGLRRGPGPAGLAVRARGARPAGRCRRARCGRHAPRTPLERLATFERRAPRPGSPRRARSPSRCR